MLVEDTFGRTPAALYLVRALNEIGNPILTRSVGKRLTATNRMVNELILGYQNESLEAKTVANTFRLMRQEIASEAKDTSQPLVDQLRRNVQIGYIKKGIRLTSVARRAERVMENPTERGLWELQEKNFSKIYFFDRQSQKLICAGFERRYNNDDVDRYTNRLELQEVTDITAELLMERSNRRCLRQGKPHMTGAKENG